MAGRHRKTIIVAGPTASGKSALAVRIAEEFGGVVINADSMQIYDGLPILSAQPDAAQQARAPHRLYGALAPDDPCSVGRWLDMAAAEARAAWNQDRLPVVTGGTGLYLQALQDGLAPVPDIPAPVRAETRRMLAEIGNERFHAMLAARDPIMGARLHPSNSQRLARAWEVIEASGRSLADWQQEPAQGRLDGDILPILLLPAPAILYAACDERFLAMTAEGAQEEARAFRTRALDPALPVMKTLGLAELIAHAEGRLDLDQAVMMAQGATRRYAKRQRTWFRHRLPARHIAYEQFSERLSDEIFSIIRQFLLTGIF